MTRDARLDPVEWSRYLDGTLARERRRELEAEAERDPATGAELREARELREALCRPFTGEEAARAVRGRVMAALDAGERAEPSPARTWRRAAFAGGSMLAVAAAAILFVSFGGAEDAAPEKQTLSGALPGELRARGDEVPDALSRRVGVDLMRVSGEALASGEQVAPDSAYVGAYTSLLDERAYLMVFAVDAAGTVHWLYPGWVDPENDPSSLALSPSRERTVLSEGVVLGEPAPGPMRIVTLLSREARLVSELEELAPAELAPDALEARWPGSHAEEIEVEVAP